MNRMPRARNSKAPGWGTIIAVTKGAMHNSSRIRLAMFSLALLASCGSRTLTRDAGSGDGEGAAGVSGVSGRGGGGGAGGVATSSGGRGGAGAGVAGTGGRGGGIGVGLAGTGGAGGSGGAGGIAGTFVTGRGGVAGSSDLAGRGGIGGSGATGGIAGTFVTGRGGIGGSSDLAGRGGGGGVVGRGGTSGRGGASGTGGIGGTGAIAGFGGRGGTAGISGSGGSAGRGGTGGTACLTCRTSILQIDARHVVYSAARNELYASIPGDADAYPNSIVVVDPTTASITSSFPVGSEPNVLALSDDGSTLWVAIDGAHAIRKVTMGATPPVVGPLAHLPKVQPDAYFDTASMAVLASAPQSVAVVLTDSAYTNEVRVFDDGVPRPTAVTDIAGTFLARPFLTAGPPGVAFGVDGNSYTFFVFMVSPSGVTTKVTSSLIPSSATSGLAYVGDRVFTSGGNVINVANLAALASGGHLPYSGAVARRDPMSVMELTVVPLPFPANERTDIHIYSNNQLIELATVSIPDSFGSSYTDLVYAGNDAAAFIRRGGPSQGLVIAHDPGLGAPIGGAGGTGGTGGAGGAGATGGGGGTGGAPDRCPGCTIATVQTYGLDMVSDPTRKLIYVASDAQSPLHPSTIVTVDPAGPAVASFVPVGNDPQVLALSDDGSALWAGLIGERRVRRLTPGATPAPGPAYVLPNLLTTGEPSLPTSIAVLPGAPSSIAVAVQGTGYTYARGVFILDDGQLRANYIQPPEVSVNLLTNGPPGYLLGIADDNHLLAFHLGAAGVTMESYGGLLSRYYTTTTGFLYSAGVATAGTGEVIDLTNPDAPVPAGHFPAGGTTCQLQSRSATRVMMLCPAYGDGPTLFMFDTATFTKVGTLTLPGGPSGPVKFVYLGGDAVALLGIQTPLQIVHAPLIGSPP